MFVSVCVLAESKDIQNLLNEHEIKVQMLSEVLPIRVLPARILSHIYVRLGGASFHSHAIHKLLQEHLTFINKIFSLTYSRFTCDHVILHPGAIRVIMTLLPFIFTPEDIQVFL